MRALSKFREQLDGSYFILFLLIWCVAFTGYALVVSFSFSEQQDNNTLTKEALLFESTLYSEVLEEEAKLSSLASSLNNRSIDKFESLSPSIFQSNQHYARIELRDEKGNLLRSQIANKHANTFIFESRKELPPSVVLNFFKAIEQQKPFWAISYDSNGNPTLEVIAPGGKNSVLVAQVDIASWITASALNLLPKFIQVSIQEKNALELTPNSAISIPMNLNGLDLRLVFRYQITRRVGIDPSSTLIIFLGLTLIGLLVRYNIEVKRTKKTQDQLALQELALAKQSQLSTLGEISTTLAHELNQPLATITNYIAVCEIRVRQLGVRDSVLDKSLNDARAQAMRAGEVVQSIRNFLRKGHSVNALVNVEESIDNLMPILNSLVKENRARIEFNSDPDLFVRIDPALFEQILLNLCKNGLDAMIETPFDSRKLVINAKLFSNEMGKQTVQIEVKDAGHGIKDQDAKKVFESFFTTKVEGMGIGLSLVKSLAESHGGNIFWTNNPEPEKGVTFTLQLPYHTGPK
jgi:signal transduction histidine kinase